MLPLASEINSFITNTNQKFIHGYLLPIPTANKYSKSENECLLNGRYKSFNALVAPEEIWNKNDKNNDIGFVKIYADEELVYDSGAIPSDLTNPIKIDVDLTGVLKVKIHAQGRGFGLLDAKFVQ